MDSASPPGENATRHTVRARFLGTARAVGQDYVLVIQLNRDTEVSSCCHMSDLHTCTQDSSRVVAGAEEGAAVEGTRGDRRAAERRNNFSESKDPARNATLAMAVNMTEDHARLPM